MRFGIVWLVLAIGCAGDEGDTGSSTSTSTTTTTTATTTATTETTTGDGVGECVKQCEFLADCCLPNTVGCPGAYPYNFTCVDGLCVPAQCGNDGECAAVTPGTVCRAIEGLGTCVVACDDDPAVCVQPNSGADCIGIADDGTAYCFEPCTGPGVFCGNQTCDEESGKCTCESAGQCLAGWDCV